MLVQPPIVVQFLDKLRKDRPKPLGLRCSECLLLIRHPQLLLTRSTKTEQNCHSKYCSKLNTIKPQTKL